MATASTTSTAPPVAATASGKAEQPRPAPLGVYVHFPYCRRRCPYCDFRIHVRQRIRHHELCDGVLAELAARQEDLDGRELVSIYFGGGTPSLWEPDCVARVVAGVGELAARRGALAPEREVTLEANPDDLPPGRLARLREAGINRLSLGAQSFDERRLRQLGRLHGVAEVRRAVAEARGAAFTSLSLDLIFGLPEQTVEELDADLSALLSLGPDHVSAYQLTVEPSTPFGAFERRGQLTPLDDDRAVDRYHQVERRLSAAGLSHYEISNYARPGHRAVHNGLYWSGGEWLGLGPAAHSFRRIGGGGGERRANPHNVDRYLARWLAGAPARPLSLAAEEPPIERLSEEQLAREALWLGLRQLDAGVDRAAFAARFGDDPGRRFGALLARFLEQGLIEEDPARLRLSARGALLADEIAAHLV